LTVKRKEGRKEGRTWQTDTQIND
jgi:hypothetical protein